MEETQQTPREHTVGELVSSLAEQISALVRGEIDYAVINAKAKGKVLGIGGALLAVAGVLALFAFLMALIGGAIALSSLVPEWAAYLIVAGSLLLFALIFALIGVNRFKKSKNYPVDPQTAINRNVEAFKKGIEQ